MKEEIEMLHQLTRDNAEEMHHVSEKGLYRELCRKIQQYRRAGEVWDIPTLQFYFYQHDSESLPF